MAERKDIALEGTVYFWFAANDTSGSGGDGASPVYDVRLAGAAAGAIPTLSGSATLLTHANYPDGCHEIAVAATAGNGFAANNDYAVFCTLLVDSQNPTGMVGSFRCTPTADTLHDAAARLMDISTATEILADVTKISGDATAAENLERLTEVLAALVSVMYIGPRGPGVWLDDTAGNTDTVLGTDGVPSNPVSTVAAARTIAEALGVRRIYPTNDTAVTLAAAYEGYEFIGIGTGNQVALGGQDVDNAHFENLTVTGTQGGTGMVQIKRCMLNAVTDLEGWIENSLLSGITTVRAGTVTTFSKCESGIPGGSTPELTFGAGVVEFALRGYYGGVQINSMTADDTLSYDCPSGQFIIGATCTGGDLHLRGVHLLTDNAGGAVIPTDDARIDVDQINAQVDAALADIHLDHLYLTSQLAVNATPTPTSTTFGIDPAFTIDGAFDGATVRFVDGTLNGVTRTVKSYASGTGVFTFEVAWPTTPVAGEAFVILGIQSHGQRLGDDAVDADALAADAATEIGDAIAAIDLAAGTIDYEAIMHNSPTFGAMLAICRAVLAGAMTAPDGTSKRHAEVGDATSGVDFTHAGDYTTRDAPTRFTP